MIIEDDLITSLQTCNVKPFILNLGQELLFLANMLLFVRETGNFAWCSELGT